MRVLTVEAFHETMSFCFNSVIQDMFGRPVRDEIFRLLEKNGIRQSEVPLRFDDVVKILTAAFGNSARVIVYKTVVELHREYSQRADFSYEDSLRDRINLLKNKVLADLIKPRHLLSNDSYYVPGPRTEGASVT